MNDLQQLQHASDDDFARRLFDAMPAMRGGIGDISEAVQSDAGKPLVCIDEAGQIDAGSDIGGCEGKVGHE